MQKENYQHRSKFRNLWLLGICIHILSFLFILDLYFTSPIKHGMTPQKSQGKPFAKRIVVFIADGLRAEAIYPKEHLNRVDYLSNLRLNQQCSWGIVHTGVPTESRPGHVAIFAGLYEDPSAILSGWQANIVEFDSVINESNYAWSYGSPDIVKIFTKTDRSKLFVEYYDPEQEDFSGRTSTINLDTWVFDKVANLLALNLSINYECQELCEEGNIFFLHLLGMDSAGHVHKPDSKEYLENLKAVDEGVKTTEVLFNNFFKDNETVFLFTSDHGMTNWGSHGDGSEHETEVPYIIWGKAVKPNKQQMDLKQTDLAALISSLIGIPIPINSVGILPYNILNGSNSQVAEAMIANVKQHVEQYKLLLKEFEMDPWFKEFPTFRDSYMQGVIEDMERILNDGDISANAIKMGEDLIKNILLANTYMRNYYFQPKMAIVMLGFFMWIAYLTISIHVPPKRDGDFKFNFFSYFLGLLIVLIVFWFLKGLNVKYFTYLYAIFPLGILYLFVNDEQVRYQTWIIMRMKNKRKFIFQMILYAALVQLLVLGFFNRIFCAFVISILALWLIQNDIGNMRAPWIIVTGTLALLQIFQSSTKFQYNGLLIGSILWYFIYYTYIIREGYSYVKTLNIKIQTKTMSAIICPLVGYTVAAINSGYVAYAFDTEKGLSDYNLIISWMLTIAALLLIPTSPTTILIRFGHIAACLITPYTLMAVNIDVIFYGILVLTLYYWMKIESKLDNSCSELYNARFDLKYVSETNLNLSLYYRRTYFYLALAICYFFAIGNMASFSGFDPQWTRTFVATFSPFLMATLIIIKMIIPFFLITCAFYAIVLYTRSNDTTVFRILLLFLDQMVLNFMLFVRNEGSWKEIGKSLSHFAVMEAMALVMMIFMGIAKYVCTFRIEVPGCETPKYERGFDDVNVEVYVDDEDTNTSYANNMRRRKIDEIKKNWWTYLCCFISLAFKLLHLIGQSFLGIASTLSSISKRFTITFDLLFNSAPDIRESLFNNSENKRNQNIPEEIPRRKDCLKSAEYVHKISCDIYQLAEILNILDNNSNNTVIIQFSDTPGILNLIFYNNLSYHSKYRQLSPPSTIKSPLFEIPRVKNIFNHVAGRSFDSDKDSAIEKRKKQTNEPPTTFRILEEIELCIRKNDSLSSLSSNKSSSKSNPQIQNSILTKNEVLSNQNELSLESKQQTKLHLRRRGSRRQYMGSSPTLIKLNTNSTLITEANAAESRMSNESMKQISYPSYNCKAATDNEPTNESDSLISFTGVTSCLKKPPYAEHLPGGLKQTCFDILSNVSGFTDSKATSIRTSEIIPKSEIKLHLQNSLQYLSTSSSTSENQATPRFIADDDDPAKYLQKVENWLQKLEKPLVIQDNSAKISDTQSQSTVSTSDFIDEADNVLNDHELNTTLIIHSNVQNKKNKLCLAQNTNDEPLIAIEIARLLREEQQNLNIDIQTLNQAYQTVKFILKCAGSIKNRKQPYNSDADFLLQPQTGNLCQASISTQTIRILSNAEPSLQLCKVNYRNQSTQNKVLCKDKKTWTICTVTKSTSSIGIQHSFSDIGTNTESLPEKTSIATQLNGTMKSGHLGNAAIIQRNLFQKSREEKIPSNLNSQSSEQDTYRILTPSRVSETIPNRECRFSSEENPKIVHNFTDYVCRKRSSERKLTSTKSYLVHKTPVGNVGLITSRYESPPITPIIEKPPSFVPRLKIPEDKVRSSKANTLKLSKIVRRKNT